MTSRTRIKEPKRSCIGAAPSARRTDRLASSLLATTHGLKPLPPSLPPSSPPPPAEICKVPVSDSDGEAARGGNRELIGWLDGRLAGSHGACPPVAAWRGIAFRRERRLHYSNRGKSKIMDEMPNECRLNNEVDSWLSRWLLACLIIRVV